MVKKSSSQPSLHSSFHFKPFDKEAVIEVSRKPSSKLLRDPTLQKLGDFLNSEGFVNVVHARNVNEYAGTLVHPNVKRDMCKFAADKGIRCGLVTVKYKNSNITNIFNAFNVKGEGLIFIDLDREGSYDLDTFTGHVQRTKKDALFLFPKKPHYYTRSGTKRNIASIKIKW